MTACPTHHEAKKVPLVIPVDLCSRSAMAGIRVDRANAPTIVEAARFSLGQQNGFNYNRKSALFASPAGD